MSSIGLTFKRLKVLTYIAKKLSEHLQDGGPQNRSSTMLYEYWLSSHAMNPLPNPLRIFNLFGVHIVVVSYIFGGLNFFMFLCFWWTHLCPLKQPLSIYNSSTSLTSHDMLNHYTIMTQRKCVNRWCRYSRRHIDSGSSTMTPFWLLMGPCIRADTPQTVRLVLRNHNRHRHIAMRS